MEPKRLTKRCACSGIRCRCKGVRLLTLLLAVLPLACAQRTEVDAAFAAVRKGNFEPVSQLKATAADVPAIEKYLRDGNEDVRREALVLLDSSGRAGGVRGARHPADRQFRRHARTGRPGDLPKVSAGDNRGNPETGELFAAVGPDGECVRRSTVVAGPLQGRRKPGVPEISSGGCRPESEDRFLEQPRPAKPGGVGGRRIGRCGRRPRASAGGTGTPRRSRVPGDDADRHRRHGNTEESAQTAGRPSGPSRPGCPAARSPNAGCATWRPTGSPGGSVSNLPSPFAPLIAIQPPRSNRSNTWRPTLWPTAKAGVRMEVGSGVVLLRCI